MLCGNDLRFLLNHLGIFGIFVFDSDFSSADENNDRYQCLGIVTSVLIGAVDRIDRAKG